MTALVKSNGFNKLLNDFFNDEFFRPVAKPAVWNSTMPAVNIRETDKSYDLEIAAPGFKKENFNIEVEDDRLVISSEIKENQEENKDQFRRREFKYASFKRSFYLPETVDQDQINASYEDGILNITLPKKEEALPQPKRLIEVG